MNRWVLRIMNLFSALFGMMSFFPILVVVAQLTYRTLANWSEDAPQITLPEALLTFALLIGMSLIGRFLTYLFDDVLQLKPLPRRLATLVLTVLAGFATRYPAMLIFDGGIIYMMMLLGAIAFWTGSSLYYRTYHQVLNLRSFAATALIYIAVLLFMFSNQCNPFGFTVYAAILLVGVLMMIVAMNQGGIDTMMKLRRHRLDLLPPKIRMYNLKLTALLTCMMMMTAVFYKPLEIGVTFMGKVLRKGLAGLLILLFDDPTADDVVSYDYSVAPEEDDDMSDIDIFADPGKGHIAWDFLLYILLIGAAILLIINLPRIIRALSALIRQLSKRFSAFLHSERTRERISTADESDEYVDVDEVVESIHDDGFSPQTEKRSVAWRNWRHRYRKYNSMEPGEARMRSGYQLMIQWLMIQEVPIKACDTTLDITRTTDLMLDFSSLSPATQQYNLVRYGGVSYDLCNPQELDKLLARMSTTKTASRLSKLALARKLEAMQQ